MNSRRSRHGFTARELAIVLVVLVGIGLVVASPIISRANQMSHRIDCAQNLKKMSLALLMYSGDNGTYFPVYNAPGSRNLEPLNTAALLADGKVYGCPSAPHRATVARASNYRYRGSGLKDDNEWATAVSLVYDQSGNHPANQWMNVLFVDGHVGGALPNGSWHITIPAIPPSTIERDGGPWNVND